MSPKKGSESPDTDNSDAIASDAMQMATDALKKVNDLRSELQELETENQRLRERVVELENRTALLDLVAADGGTVEDRAVVLLQNLYNEAYAAKERGHLENVTPSASMDWNGAKRALGGSVNHREQLYDAMRRAVELVHSDDLPEQYGDSDLSSDGFDVQFVKESRTSDRNTRLVVDLSDTETLKLSNGELLTPPQEEDR